MSTVLIITNIVIILVICEWLSIGVRTYSNLNVYYVHIDKGNFRLSLVLNNNNFVLNQ